MAEANKIVVHALNGKVLKGTTQDFFAHRPMFHVQSMDGGPGLEVRCKALKAIFFVKNFDGDSSRRDTAGFLAGPGETAQGRKVAVRFKDGELLCGYSLTYSAEREAFFIFPADPQSNNLRIYVMTGSTVEVKIGPAAEQMVKKSLDKSAAA